MRAELATLPGVTDVGLGSPHAARAAIGIGFDLKADGDRSQPGEAMPRADFRTANPEYFRGGGHSAAERTHVHR